MTSTLCATKLSAQKSMKIIFTTLAAAFSIAATQLEASGSSTIYRSPEAFSARNIQTQKTANPFNSVENLRTHDFFWNNKTISFTVAGKRTNLSKNEVFGYTDELGRIFRFYNNEALQLLDSNQVYLYGRKVLKPAGKSYTKETEYFYSTTPGGMLVRLTPQNLAVTFGTTTLPANLNLLANQKPALYSETNPENNNTKQIIKSHTK